MTDNQNLESIRNSLDEIQNCRDALGMDDSYYLEVIHPPDPRPIMEDEDVEHPKPR